MALDQSTLDSETPRTRDGRSYPDHLRAYETYDRQFLPLLAEHGELSPSDLSHAVSAPKLRSVLSRWMASAEWRGLIERHDGEGMASRRTYVLSDRGRTRAGEQH
jgi:hypothetical protein